MAKRTAESADGGSEHHHADTSLEETLRNLSLLLQRREERLNLAEAAFASEKDSAGHTSPTDVLHLNVGGTLCTCLRKTLCQVEGSMLASRFSGRWDDGLERDRDGNFFIDQPHEIFRPLLDHLRSLAIDTPRAPPIKAPTFAHSETRDAFVRLVEYYGCTPVIFPTTIELYRGVPGSLESTPYPNLGVKSTKWSTCVLAPQGHSREIRSFEVTLRDAVERFHVGWAYTTSKYADSFKSHLGDGDWKGVGEEPHSIALDCCRSALLVGGDFFELEAMSVGKGSVIRCDRIKKEWAVNGNVVVSPKLVPELNSAVPGRKCTTPAFSGRGEWAITDVELDH